MSPFSSRFLAVVTASLFIVTANPAFGIVVPIGLASRLPFSNDYPEHARQQVRAALETRDCRFIEGHSTMRVSTLRFRGDTTAMNVMLKRLADCPAATVTVSFKTMDGEFDWQVIHSVKSDKFAVIVNLKSNQIKIEELSIPPAKGPELKR